MPKHIIQHRRGTTAEWQKIDLIPEEGELVIEECSDGTVKCKIGSKDKKKFSELPYIDDNTKSVLLQLIESNSTNIAIQSHRIDSLLALPEGSTSADGELVDIRIGYDGIMHDTAGNAVRDIGNNLNKLRDSLSQYIDTQAIDGLYYDYAGEVGLKEPYMLYLTTNNDVITESGVKIISGAGGGGGGSVSSSTLKIGYITTSPMVVTPKDKAILKFTFSGTDSSGDEVLQANASWRVNGTTKAYSTVTSGENEFDVTKYLSTGTTKILLTITDDNGGLVTKTWSVQLIDLSITSNFNDKIANPIGENIIFTYTPTGSLEKTIKIYLDGEEIINKDLGAHISGTELKEELFARGHGSYLLEAYLEAYINNEWESSEHIFKDIIWYDAQNNDMPVISSSIRAFKAKQYETTKILYTVYDPTTETPSVKIEVDGKVVKTEVIKPNTDYATTLTDTPTPTSMYSFSSSDIGLHTIKIICGSTEKIIEANVEKIDAEIVPVTTGLVFDFNPVGKTNSDIDRLWSYDDIHLRVSDNFDWTNGGYKPDDPDGPCFLIKSGSKAIIDYKLFADDAKARGKEFKIVFKTKNASDPSAIFLSCIDNTTAKDHIGLEMGIQNAKIYGQNGNLDLAYSEEDIIEFEFNISKYTDLVPMIMGYEDGVPSRPLVYDSSFSFTQNTPKEIVIGSDDCDVYIYRLKVYNTSLTNTDILNNFIADARTTDEMIARYTRNQIYDENNKLTPESLAEKCPWLRIYKVSAPHFTNNKSDKVSNTTITQIYKNGDPVLDNWTCYNAQHSGQGTSSNNYGAAGRNLDFIMNKSDSYFEFGDGSTGSEISLTRESIPVSYLNAKVNIASSNNITNAILAKRYNQFNPYRRPFVRESGFKVENIKDTMEFHNCVIFIQETDPDLSTHREFADTDYHFYAIGNIGDSKKTDNTRATDPLDPYECCIEIMDVGLPLSDFPVDTMINAMSYSTDEITGARNYTWAKDSNLGILYEKQSDNSYTLTSDTTIDYDKTYYIDILENDDFSEDYTYGWRYISDDEDSSIINYCKQKWIDFYRFVTTSSDEEFKLRLSDYFVIDSALYYYLFTTRYCMVDNRAKNTFWHYSKTNEVDFEGNPIRKWDLCWDYDNDTSLGLNNYGKQVYRYGLEDIDVDAAGVEIFREMDSTFFCRVRDLFGPELRAMYRDLEGKNAWHAESFIKQCDDLQNEFPEELWRLDIDRKYIRTFTSSFINNKGDDQFLKNMCNGRMKYHRRQWERNQEQYMSSKYQTTRASGDNYHANFRFGDSGIDNPTVPANYQLTLTPFSYIYLNVQYGGTSPHTVRVTDTNINTPITVPYSGTSADIVNVYNAAAIRDFGDLSACYPITASIGNATRVKKLVLGNSTVGYDNKAFDVLTTDANPLLEELDLTNISGLEQTLDLSQLINLKKLKAFGTSTSSVLFANNGKIEYAELPAVSGINLKNLIYLTSENLKLESYDNVVTLVVESCPSIDKVKLFNDCHNLQKVRLTEVDFGTLTYKYFTDKIFNLKGIAADGSETPDAWLEGKCFIEYLTGSQYAELCKRYPHLTIDFETLESTVTFMAPDCETELCRVQAISKNSTSATCDNPVFTGIISTPTKQANAKYSYQFAGWTSLKDPEDLTDPFKANLPQEDALKNIWEDRILYPAFTSDLRSYKVSFLNPSKNGNILLQTVNTYFGQTPEYSEDLPSKLDVTNSSDYEFTSWWPQINWDPLEVYEEPLLCYAQYSLLDSVWYTITTEDVDYEILDNNTISISNFNNDSKAIIKIPEYFNINGKIYEISKIGTSCFQNKSIEYIRLSEKIIEISDWAFNDCKKLVSIELPESLLTIKQKAFTQCISLKSIRIPKNVNQIDTQVFCESPNLELIEVDTGNAYFYIVDNCLIDTKTNILLAGLYNSKIPADNSIVAIADYAFYGSNIESITLPNSIKYIGSNAFASCKKLTEVIIPEGCEIGPTAFAWCDNLTKVILPKTLQYIKTFVFHKCPIEEIIIPENVLTVSDRAFGENNSLKLVTFKNSAGTTIDKQAFYLSGHEDGLFINVPWQEGAIANAPWGAINYTINYNVDPVQN